LKILILFNQIMKSSVIIFPGSNCDRDMDVALKKFGFKNQMVWHNEPILPKSDLIVLPGGFSYGDYLRCGSIAGKSKIINSIIKFAQSGGLILGICNGFQILTETGLLPGVLQQNKYLQFICKNVFIKINNKENKFFKNIKKNILELHIAHNEGSYFCSNNEIKSIEDNNQIAVKYCNHEGVSDELNNPNGAMKNIAGILNKEKNILGMMPHPERMIDKYLSGDDGSLFFKSLIENLK
jgi:phosphoribosylformylglycinamidine synthase subunit PurQ / glutaminase